MREKSFSLHENYDDFRLVYEYAKRIITCMENTLKDKNIFGEEAKSILPYTENVPFDIIFRSKPNKIYDSKSPD